MSSKITIYGVLRSPPVRAALMALEALELDYNFKAIDVLAGELQSPEYLKKNPQHTIPTLEETDGTCIWDSHAIMAYLVRKYGKTDELYPKDFYQRAVVDQRLHYEDGVLFIELAKNGVSAIIHGRRKKEDTPEVVKSIIEAYEMLETFLGDHQYMAGDNLTIADFSIVTSVTALILFAPLDAEKFPKLTAWLERIKKLPYYEKANAQGHSDITEYFKTKLAEIN